MLVYPYIESHLAEHPQFHNSIQRCEEPASPRRSTLVMDDPFRLHAFIVVLESSPSVVRCHARPIDSPISQACGGTRMPRHARATASPGQGSHASQCFPCPATCSPQGCWPRTAPPLSRRPAA